MKIILVRHGESERNAKVSAGRDTPLTKKGKLQAELLGKKLKKEKIKIDKIYTSNLIRSRETAKIISEEIKVPVKTGFKGLNEYGVKSLKNRLRTLFNLRVRKLKKFLEEITKNKEKDKTIMVVAHGVTNRMIIGILLGMPLKKQLLQIWQHNAAISILTWNKKFKNWGLEFSNDRSHLPEKMK